MQAIQFQGDDRDTRPGPNWTGPAQLFHAFFEPCRLAEHVTSIEKNGGCLILCAWFFSSTECNLVGLSHEEHVIKLKFFPGLYDFVVLLNWPRVKRKGSKVYICHVPLDLAIHRGWVHVMRLSLFG